MLYTKLDAEQLETLQLINSVQNKLNSFVNIDIDDLNKIQKHINKHDLNYDETVELLLDLNYA